MEVEGIGAPGEKTDNEVEPIPEAQLCEQGEWVDEWFRLLPLAVLLAIVVPDHDALVPYEQILQGLFGSGKGALGQRVGWTIGARHDV